MQGMGVNAPIAAEVAAATCGFASVLHMPNGEMFTIGMLSRIVASGCGPWLTRLTGNTVNDPGARPSLQRSLAPFVTSFGIGVGTYERRAARAISQIPWIN
jgi:hypothetical protein